MGEENRKSQRMSWRRRAGAIMTVTGLVFAGVGALGLVAGTTPVGASPNPTPPGLFSPDSPGTGPGYSWSTKIPTTTPDCNGIIPTPGSGKDQKAADGDTDKNINTSFANNSVAPGGTTHFILDFNVTPNSGNSTTFDVNDCIVWYPADHFAGVTFGEDGQAAPGSEPAFKQSWNLIDQVTLDGVHYSNPTSDTPPHQLFYSWGPAPSTDLAGNAIPPGSTICNFAKTIGNNNGPGGSNRKTGAACTTIPVVHTTLTESASPTGGVSPQNVTFTYRETNDGTDPIGNVVVTGSLCGPASYVSGDTNTNNLLDPGETWVFTCTTSISGAGLHTDNATATGAATDKQTTPDEHASASVTLTTETPVVHTTLTESANPTSAVVPTTVTFTYHETNDGNQSIGSVAVSGDLCGSATYVSGDTNTNNLLDPGETWVFTCSKVISTPGSFTDNATAIGSATGEQATPDEHASAGGTLSSAPVVHTTLTESASPTGGVSPQNVTFTYRETNDGTDPIGNVVVTGSLCGPASYVSGDTNTNNLLDPGETWVFTCTTSISGAGLHTDNATATGAATDKQTTPDEHASASVTLTPPTTPPPCCSPPVTPTPPTTVSPTTAAPTTTTTTAPAQVLPEVTSSTTVPPTTSTTKPTEVLGTQTLPFTGSDTRGLFLLSALFLLIGGLALLAADRQPNDLVNPDDKHHK